MSKQTAVEYLQYTYFKTGMLYRTDFKKAKEMEREQIKSTFRDAQIFEVKEYPITDVQYYNETYGGQDESNH